MCDIFGRVHSIFGRGTYFFYASNMFVFVRSIYVRDIVERGQFNFGRATRFFWARHMFVFASFKGRRTCIFGGRNNFVFVATKSNTKGAGIMFVLVRNGFMLLALNVIK